MLKAPSVALRSILRITIPLLPFRIVPHVVGHAREEHRRFRLLLVLDAVHQVETVDVVFQLRGQLVFVLKKGHPPHRVLRGPYLSQVMEELRVKELP